MVCSSLKQGITTTVEIESVNALNVHEIPAHEKKVLIVTVQMVRLPITKYGMNTTVGLAAAVSIFILWSAQSGFRPGADHSGEQGH